jgi:hypothetical protein
MRPLCAVTAGGADAGEGAAGWIGVGAPPELDMVVGCGWVPRRWGVAVRGASFWAGEMVRQAARRVVARELAKRCTTAARDRVRALVRIGEDARGAAVVHACRPR